MALADEKSLPADRLVPLHAELQEGDAAEGKCAAAPGPGNCDAASDGEGARGTPPRLGNIGPPPLLPWRKFVWRGTCVLIVTVFLTSTNIAQRIPVMEEEASAAAASSSFAGVACADITRRDINKTKSNVTLTLQLPRRDRLGSRIQLPLAAWIVARHRGWNFCSPMEGMTSALSFPICFEEYDPQGLLEGEQFHYHEAEFDLRIDGGITKPGVYYIDNKHWVRILWNKIQEHEGPNSTSMLDDQTVKDWRQMILGACVRPEMDKMLWLSKDSVRIAVHARRGDIIPGKRNDAWIGDDQLIALVELSKYHIRKKRGNETKIEVHMFSESYGVVNWTRYEGLVDEFHLAEFGSSDIDLNLRDWKHFVLADVLIIGGTFSRMPALARPDPSPRDGLPMTFSWSRFPTRKWISWAYIQRPKGLMAVPLPDGQIVAKTGLDYDSDPSDYFSEILPIPSTIGNMFGIWKG